LIYNQLPENNKHYNEFLDNIKRGRILDKRMKELLELMPKDCHPMDVLRSSVSFYGQLVNPPYENRKDMIPQEQLWCSQLIGAIPSIINYWYHYHHHNGIRIETKHDGKVSEHFLDLLHLDNKTKLNKNHYKTMDVGLILYAEHEFNASTFSARVTSSTCSD